MEFGSAHASAVRDFKTSPWAVHGVLKARWQTYANLHTHQCIYDSSQQQPNVPQLASPAGPDHPRVRIKTRCRGKKFDHGLILVRDSFEPGWSRGPQCPKRYHRRE
eukprot:9483939-Pyramimonas_sp.AAC.1